MCLDEERWQDASGRQEHDLEEIRRLFARYRLAAALARVADERPPEATPEREPEPTTAGTAA